MDQTIHFVNGAVSGMFGLVLSHPIDTIKTNIQDRKPLSYNLRSLYRGVVPAMSGVGLEKAIVFGTYKNTSRILRANKVNDKIAIASSGALSGLTASLVVTPVERFKILAQTGNLSRNQIKMHHFYPTTLYRGLSATFTREVPGFAIYFSVYEHLKRVHCQRTNSDLPLSSSFLYGGLSGGIAWFGIYPQDVVKTRMQADTTDANTNYYRTARQIYREGGVRLFFKGFHLALLRAVPLHAGTFMMMEVMNKWNSN